MEAFWNVFLILLLIVPALWLAYIVWTIGLYLIMLIIASVVTGVSWIISKAKGE